MRSSEREPDPPARRRRGAVVALDDGPQVRERRAPEDVLVRVRAPVGGREVHGRRGPSVLQEDLPIGPADGAHPSPVGGVGRDRDPAVHLAGGGGADRLVEASRPRPRSSRSSRARSSARRSPGPPGPPSARRAEPPRSLPGSGRTAALTVRASVPSSARRTSSVPGKRPVRRRSFGDRGSARGRTGIGPRTRKEPPGGGVSRSEVAAGPAGSSGGDEAARRSPTEARRRRGSRAWGWERSLVGGDAVHATTTSEHAATVARAPRGSRRRPGVVGCIPTTLAGRARDAACSGRRIVGESVTRPPPSA